MASVLVMVRREPLQSKVVSILEDSRLEVRRCETEEKGLRMLEREKASVVLLEDFAAGVPAADLIRDIRKISPEQSVVVLLEEDSLDRALELMNLGAYDCLETSFSPAALLGVVRRGAQRFETEVLQPAVPRASGWKRYRGALQIAFLLALVCGIWYYRSWDVDRRIVTEETEKKSGEKEYRIPYPHPSGIAYDGENIWVCDWYTQSLYRHLKDESFRILSVHHFADLNPVSVAWSGSVLWVVSTNGKIQKRALDDKLSLLYSLPSPGPNPSGIAHDGTYLWTADATLKKIYRHFPDPKLSVVAEYDYPAEMPIGLFWDGKHLWSVDGYRKALLRHRADGGQLVIDEVKQFYQYRDMEFKLVGATFDGERFWTLSENPSKVIRHAVKAGEN